MSSGDLAVNHLERISLASRAAKDSSAIKVELEGLGEGTRGVTEEADLSVGIDISSGLGMYSF